MGNGLCTREIMPERMTKSLVADKLLAWYDAHLHSFPWRGINDPYKTWISEVMLQQTRVLTVVPYYNRWVVAFPSLQCVARANADYILKMWEGLGYYARVRNFHSACKIVMREYSGVIPNDKELFSVLPGVGPYISGAVMSIAFNHPVPAVDSNAFRVISRLNAIDQPFIKCKKKAFDVLSSLITDKRPGDFNQALMDFGREVCTPKNPDCNACHLSSHCIAAVNNAVDKFPVTVKSKGRPHYRVAVGIIWYKNKILISKRKEKGLLGGMWEFPGGKIARYESAKKCVIREAKEELGVNVRPKSFVKQIKHAYSHFSITLDAYHCDYIDGSPTARGCADWRWIFPAQIAELPFPAANHKLFGQIYKEFM